ncbi:hypothetical protein PLEOSDRAFT_1108866 [Pleurotus ostreatus PC15]|uniref:Uncharacterized protein n=1 Tax=Pleurotus ostreatus (strain PC15) TaxID=1137138 RepID=A0A067N5D1_PLEO1|nr:hypothetical protein PLEOSDRAFT_1108866 [Pleurotus ostreatus PC15]
MSSNTDVLSEIGFDFIIKVVRIAVGTACYGIYVLLMFFSTTILCRRGWRHIGAMVLLTLTWVLFLGCTMFLIIDLSDIIYRFKIILIEGPDELFADKLVAADAKLQNFVWAGEMLFIFLLILGDSIVLWRTLVLYKYNLVPVFIPGLTWVGSVVAAFYEVGCDNKFGWTLPDSRPSAASVGIESCAKADTVSFSLSYSTNIICTTLIMFRAWQYRQNMKSFMGTARKTTQVEKVLVLLVESGFVYLAIYTFQAVPIYGGSFNPKTVIVVQAANAIIQQAMGMYPTIIVVLVQLQKTLWDTPELSFMLGSRSQMQFASASLSVSVTDQLDASNMEHSRTAYAESGEGRSGTSSKARGLISSSSLFGKGV